MPKLNLRRKELRIAPKDGPATPARNPSLIHLGVAADYGIAVKLDKPESLSSCGLSLMLMDRASKPAKVELTGAVLLPEGAEANNFQRLMVAGAEGLTDISVTLRPGEEVKMKLETCCLDHPKTPPEGKTRYSISRERAPERLINAARRFVTNKVVQFEAKTSYGLEKVQAECWKD